LHPVGVVRAPVPASERTPPERTPRRTPDLGAEIAEAAAYYLSHRPKGFRDDCSGFVSAALARVGLDRSGSTASLWEAAQQEGLTHHRKDPSPGDVAFFDDTYDRDHDGKWNDPLSHVAVVLEVARDGAILLAHGGTSQGRTTLHMNLRRPHDRTDPDTGEVVNDYLRRKTTHDPPGAKYLSAELWRGFATFGRPGAAVAANSR
jgi:hypothetical protein